MPRASNPLKEESGIQMLARETILKAWLRDGIPWLVSDSGEKIRDSDGELMLERFPKNIRELARWTSDGYSATLASKEFEFAGDIFSLSQLKHLSRATQNQTYHLTRRNECISTIELLKEQVELQIAGSNKSKKIDKLERKLAHAIKIIAAQEDEVRGLRMTVKNLTREMNKSERRHKNNEERLRSDFQEQVDKNISLTKSLAKITPLKATRRRT
jgi:hypothetical protein